MEEDIKILEEFCKNGGYKSNGLPVAFIEIPYTILKRAIENLIQRFKVLKAEYKREQYRNELLENKNKELEEENKELKKYKRIAELTKISCCTAQNCEALNNAIRAGIENVKLKEGIQNIIENELPDDDICNCCSIYDVNGIDLKIKLQQLLEE